MQRLKTGVLALLSCLVFPCAVLAANHVRVILDTSGSMKKNDPHELAKLATVLLYDLASPDSSQGDTFEVLPFSICAPRAWKSGPPPPATAIRINPRQGRSEFVRAVTRDIHYTCSNTYYYPGLKDAVNDFKAIPKRASDRKVVVLVTDGVPEDPDHGEAIKRELIPAMEASGIRLYVIAIGEAAGEHRDLITGILGTQGDFLADPRGDTLLRNMIEIYSRSFGYSSAEPVVAVPTMTLDLDNKETPARVAVVSYWTKKKPPEFHLHAPPGGIVNNPDGYQTADTIGSYAITWALRPNPGAYTYTMTSPAPSSLVAVLRPVDFVIDFESPTTGGQIRSTMGDTPLPLRVVVRPSGGAKGRIADVALSFYTEGELNPDGEPERSNKKGPASDGNRGDDRYFDIYPIYKNPRDKREFYEGRLNVALRRRDALIATKDIRIIVYPAVHLRAIQPAESARVQGQVRAIKRRESATAGFEFRTLDRLPHAGRPSYPLQAWLDKDLASNPALAGARLLVDGELVDLDVTPGEDPSPWTRGKTFNADALLGRHDVMLILGRPKEGDPRKPVDIPIHFKLAETPYDTFPVVEDFHLRALIAPPTFWQQWSAWIAVLMGTLAILELLWFTRPRPQLPPRLCFSVRVDETEGAWDRRSLADTAVLSKLLGRTPHSAAYASSGMRVLGWIRPVDRNLYRFRPNRGVSLASDGGPVRHNGAGAVLSTYRTYVAKTDSGGYQFRVDFD